MLTSISRPMRPTTITAIMLGLTALVTTTLSTILGLAEPQAWGLVALVISAHALGIHGAAIACAIALIPAALWHGDVLMVSRLAILCLTVGLIAERSVRWPPALLTLGLWLSVFGPGLLYLHAVGAESAISVTEISFAALSDILAALIAGTVLMNSAAWANLAQRPRSTNPFLLVGHIVLLVATATLWGGIALGTRINSLSVASEPWSILGWTTLAGLLTLGVPALVSWRLVETLRTDIHELFRHELTQQSQESFSGRATEYWRRSRALQKKEAAPSPIPLTADHGVAIFNTKGLVVHADRIFTRLSRATDELKDAGVELLSPNGLIQAALSRAYYDTEQRGSSSMELKLETAPHIFTYLEICGHKLTAPIPEIAAEDQRIALTIRNVTDRRTVEKHLLEAQQLRSLADLTRGIAHGFNNALTAIIGYATFAQRTSDPTAREQSLYELVRAAHSGSDLVKQLMGFLDQGSGERRALDMVRFVTSQQLLLQQLVGDQFEVSISHDTPALAKLASQCDQHQLRQVLTNLVLNARDAYPARGGTISITLDHETIDESVCHLVMGAYPGDFVRIRVTDHGVGMTPEVLAHAGDPLFTTKAQNGQNGLGLPIVYAIVRAHDGFMAIESKPDRGTTVSVYLPRVTFGAVSKQTPAEEHTPAFSDLPHGNEEKILVVEDESSVRELVQRMLTTLGYNVTTCVNGIEALEQCAKQKFDLVLLDMIMPRMGGLDFLAQLPANTPRTVLMTGYAGETGAGTSALEVLNKPFDLNTLARTIARSLQPPSVNDDSVNPKAPRRRHNPAGEEPETPIV